MNLTNAMGSSLPEAQSKRFIEMAKRMDEHLGIWRNRLLAAYADRRKFLKSLVARGLYGIKSITSEAHEGIKAALKAVFPGVPWPPVSFIYNKMLRSMGPSKG